jgi:hypothetical protein
MSNTTMVWSQWLDWVEKVEAAEQERQRSAPPLDLSDPSHLEGASFRDYAAAIQRHSHLAEQGKKLLAEFLHLNTNN